MWHSNMQPAAMHDDPATHSVRALGRSMSPKSCLPVQYSTGLSSAGGGRSTCGDTHTHTHPHRQKETEGERERQTGACQDERSSVKMWW